MPPLRVPIVVALALAIAVPGRGSTGDGEAPDGLATELLSNGLEVTVLADASHPIVATQLWVGVGSANEEPGQRGLAHLFEHLMFGETTSRPRDAYSLWHHRFGGDDNAFTSPDETVYVSQIPPAGHDGVLELEADRMRGLVVSADLLANEKRIVTEELRLRTENDPFTRALVAGQKALLDGHPYAFDPNGSKEDVSAVTVEAARAFHDRYYRPDRIHLVVVGPVDAEKTLDMIRDLFGSLEAGGSAPPEVPLLVDWPFPAKIELREEIPPVEVAIVGVPLPPPDAEDAAAVEILLHMLAGGAVDRFREEMVVRSRKALEAGTETIALKRGGAVAFWSASLPYRRESSAFRFMDEARARLARLDWLTDEALAGAKRALRRQILRQSWFAAARADAIGRARWWRGDGMAAFDRAHRLDAVTRDEVAGAFRRYLVDREPVRAYLVPERVPVLVRLFGWLYPLVSR